MRLLRTLYARQLNPNKPRGFWSNAKACMTIAFFLSLHVWTFLLIYQRFIFYDFFILGRALLLYFPVLAAVILYAVIDWKGIRSTLLNAAQSSAQRKQLNRKVWTYYLSSFAILVFAIKLSPHIRPPHDKVIAAYYGDSEYWRFEAIREMGISKDTFYIKHLMHELDDPRASMMISYKGMTMDYVKTQALYKITGEIKDTTKTSHADSINVAYWKQKYPQYYVPYKMRGPRKPGDFSKRTW